MIYWASTGIFAGLMLFTAFNYVTSESMKAAFVHLGFPSYFRIELAIAKVLGAAVLLIPMRSAMVKYAGYAGFAIVLVSASIAHLSMGDPFMVAAMPMVFLAILALSLFYYKEVFENQPALKNQGVRILR
jgi:hypothetical protein